jgi:hypothetical protein
MRRHVYSLLSDPILYQFEQRATTFPNYASRATKRSYSVTSQTWDRHRKPWELQGEQTKSRPSSKTPGKVLRPTDVQKELVYLGDPLKLANHVFNLLRQEKFDDAELLVWTASKSFPCTVSWNHLINWQLSQGKVNVAIKSYNEVCNSALPSGT